MVEKHIEHDPGIAPSHGGKARQGDVHQGMAVGVHVNAPMQGDRRFDPRVVEPLQRSLDEIAIETAEQLFPARAAEVQVREIVHGPQLSTTPPISL
ncbi:hypothetical protein D3C84_803500 [compost metagenome]